MKFTHLHVHSHYSLLDGLAKIPELVELTKERGMDSIALTDHGSLYGAIEFYEKAKKFGIKPIIGCELYVAARRYTDKEAGLDDKRYHLTVIAKTTEGYQNLVKLVTEAHLKGFYYKPRVDREILRRYAKGLIALSGCFNGEIPKALAANQKEKAEGLVREYQEIFGKENFYLEIQPHFNYPDQKIRNSQLRELGQKFGARLVATNDIHYCRAEDSEAQDILVSVQTGNRVEDENRLTMRAANLSIRAPREMAELLPEFPDAIESTAIIADTTNVEIELGKNKIPPFVTPPGYTQESFLEKLCLLGVKKRYGIDAETFATSNDPFVKTVRDRYKYEFEIIRRTGFTSYFLVVQDFVNWAKDQGVVVGPGRGSAAGSIISYLLNITSLDPLKYNLLFERFLNPERISMPDIDLDFADTRRDEVIEYVKKKYGSDHVAQIITFGTMAARAAIRDTGRALGMSYAFCDQLAKLIPFNPTQGMKEGWLDECLKNVLELKQFYETNAEAKRLIDAARKLEGVARHASIHASGVVIGPEALNNFVPLQYATRGGGEDKEVLVTQYDMKGVESLGLLKMDFLGLRNLSIIERTVEIVKKIRGVEIEIDRLRLDDKPTYRLFQEAKTTGVFQFESQGMKRYLKELKPTELEDLIALVALYRPGPMEYIPSYINRKHKREPVRYLHPKLGPILGPTYGIGVYQEQMMQIARDLAGFTLPEADTLRKAIGKKIKSLLAEQQEKLVKGMKANGIDGKTAEAIWELFPAFARYGFNRCLAGDTEIYDPKTGRLIPIEAIHGKKETLRSTLSLTPSQKIHPQPVVDAIANSEKPVWKLVSRSGRKIKATFNHPFLTPTGWKLLRDIKPGEKIATPRLIPEPKSPIRVPFHKLAVLGYLLAEGNFCHPQSFYFYSKSEAEIADYLSNLRKFENTKGTLNTSKPAVSVYAGRINLKKSSEAVGWIKTLGLKYKKATEKFFPEFVFRLPNKDLAVVIGKMFQGDGCINLGRKDPQIFYATSSRDIAWKLQHLLLRFSILSSVHVKHFKYRGGIKIGFTVCISRYDNFKKFIDSFGAYFVGEKAESVEVILKTHPILNGSLPPWSARGSYDVIPVSMVLEPVRTAVSASNLNLTEFARSLDLAVRLFSKDGRKVGYLRETTALIADKLQDKALASIAESDIYWDEVKTIEYAGVEETYDLTIKETHNFVANDIIVHNSHAACYALVAYQTGYLKTHYPAEYMAALMTAEGFEIERVAFLIDEAKSMNIEVLAPDINESFETFTVVDIGESTAAASAKAAEGKAKIRFGLSAIKNVGSNIVESIIRARKSGGKFISITDFIERLPVKDLNRKSLESLAKCGALDSLGERNRILVNLDLLLNYARDKERRLLSNQGGLFDAEPVPANFSISLQKADPASKKQKLAWEKELLGLYITEHPLTELMSTLRNKSAIPIRGLDAESVRGQLVSIGGVVSEIKKILTKNGEAMLFVTVEDTTAKTEVLVFPSVLAKYPSFWQPDKLLLVRGKVSDKDGIPKILCDQVSELI